MYSIGDAKGSPAAKIRKSAQGRHSTKKHTTCDLEHGDESARERAERNGIVVPEQVDADDRICTCTMLQHACQRNGLEMNTTTLTDACNDEDDDEGVHHRRDREGERCQHFPQRPDLAEQPDHPDRPKAQHQADRHVDRREADEGQPDNDQVQKAPAVGEEGLEPIRVEIEDELDGEDYGEEEVQRVLSRGKRASIGRHIDDGLVGSDRDCPFFQLGADDSDQKVLQPKIHRRY